MKISGGGQAKSQKAEIPKAEKFDVIIIGGGAAGMSAALWCDDLKLNALLLESGAKLGGQLHAVYNPIENHLGAAAQNGAQLNEIFLKQIEKRRFELRLNAEVESVNLETKTVCLIGGDAFSARAIIVAVGVKRRKLDVSGEEKFQNRGLLESGKRDSEKVKNKIVAIVGGGDAALENATILAETAAKVYVVNRGREVRARAEFVETARKNEKIEILTETEIVEILGKESIEAVKLKSRKEENNFILPIDAALIRIGVEPNTKIFREKLELDENGYIKVNSNCETNVKNIFAVGDAANPIAPTISTAVGMGATAVKAILNYELRITS